MEHRKAAETGNAPLAEGLNHTACLAQTLCKRKVRDVVVAWIPRGISKRASSEVQSLDAEQAEGKPNGGRSRFGIASVGADAGQMPDPPERNLQTAKASPIQTWYRSTATKKPAASSEAAKPKDPATPAENRGSGRPRTSRLTAVSTARPQPMEAATVATATAVTVNKRIGSPLGLAGRADRLPLCRPNLKLGVAY